MSAHNIAQQTNALDVDKHMSTLPLSSSLGFEIERTDRARGWARLGGDAVTRTVQSLSCVGVVVQRFVLRYCDGCCHETSRLNEMITVVGVAGGPGEWCSDRGWARLNYRVVDCISTMNVDEWRLTLIYNKLASEFPRYLVKHP